MTPLFASALFCAAGAVRAEEPLFPLFKTFCAETRAAPSAALAAAEKQNWTPVPKSMVSAFKIEGAELSNADGRMTTTADGLRVMIVGHVKDFADIKGHEADVCAVAFTAVETTAVQAEAAAFAAVNPVPGVFKGAANDESATVFAWRDKEGRHEPVSAADLESGVAFDATVSVLMAGAAGPATLVALIAPTK